MRDSPSYLHPHGIYVVPEFELVIGRLGNKPNDWDESYLVNKIVASLKE
jgi:hypothetical protein